jgi:hypothetical protein
MADYGIKIGDNISTDTDRLLKFTSKYPSLKIYKWGETASKTLSGDTATREVAHDLDYAPSILVFAEKTANTFQPLGGNDDISGTFAYADEDKLYIQTYNAYGKLTVLPACKYYILVDKAEAFSGESGISLTNDYGFKVSPNGKDVLNSEEYELSESSKYRSLQYFSESIKLNTLTLPEMWAEFPDEQVTESTYVDFNHGLGYPPLFIAWFYTGSIYKEIPYAEYQSILLSDLVNSDYYTKYLVSATCDATKIRVTFTRVTKYDYYQWVDSGYGDHSSGDGPVFSEQTITIKVLPFAENLQGLNYGE